MAAASPKLDMYLARWAGGQIQGLLEKLRIGASCSCANKPPRRRAEADPPKEGQGDYYRS